MMSGKAPRKIARVVPPPPRACNPRGIELSSNEDTPNRACRVRGVRLPPSIEAAEQRRARAGLGGGRTDPVPSGRPIPASEA
jgi:hypothetical protein